MDKVKDEFRGFEAGFEGFPKHLPDDCVEYTLFVIDSKVNSQRDLRGRFEVIRKQSRALTDRLLKDYIWQRDSFNLQIECDNGTMHLRGLTNYGDSVEDEWLIVYLLRELSKQFQELWIKVVDTDGEFLLIEAANALPRWLNPEVANNRVWLHNGELYIIPLDTAVASTKQITATSKSLNLEEAIDIIKTSKTIIHSPLIEAEAFYRLRNYPSQITASLHHSPITIPRKLAHILHIRPQSIAPAIEAFYLRDPIALKKLQSIASELIFPPEDLVTISTRFTRVLYAQLKSQQFSTPAAWKNILVEPEIAALSETIKAQKYARLETGMKVTSGFEMLLRDSKYDGNRLVRELKIIVDDLNAEDNADLFTNEDISNWEGVTREDDEKWLDINFEDFEKELQGKGQENKSTQVPPTFGPPRPSGFGDANTEADLKKMVERFEAFLNDETAGAEGAELDDMDIDDDDDTTDDSEEEDKEVSFDEKEFANMMREMMGLPSEESGENMDGQLLQAGKKLGKDKREKDINSEEESGEEREDAKIREVMERMKAELNEGGALDLELTPQKLSALIGKAHSNEANNSLISQNEDEADSDEEVDIDFNLAKNLLDSFKSQAGMAGPGGNLMGMMGFHLPRDEGDTTSTEDHP